MEGKQAPMGVLGGTFDPIHYGHLRTGYELMQALELGQVRFLPCGQPPHREQPRAPGDIRLAMVRAALEGHAGLVADDRELKRNGPSYSVDTLEDLRADFPAHPLCLIVGMDAFLGLPSWHRWKDLLELAHVVVARRPGWTMPRLGALEPVLTERLTEDPGDLHRELAGRIFIHTATQLEISSTAIREMTAAGYEPRFLTPDAVCRIIEESGCYGRR